MSNKEEDPYDWIPDTEALTGEEYQIEETEFQRAGPHKVAAETENEGVVAGPKVRRMFERACVYEDRPLWIGYDDTARTGFREAPIRFDALKRHLWISGTTGSGKTTVLQNKAVQHAYSGYGFCNIDPKASGDTIELLQMLPEERLNDVILISPGALEFDKVVAINMLDMPAIEDEDQREKEIESRLENLIAIFDNDEYWGVNMQTVAESMGRAMLRHNGEIALDPDRDPTEKYTIIDMYFILLNQERRAEFAAMVDDPFLKQYLVEIVKMDDETLRPLTKRIKSWVENAIVRKIIARRDSTIDWDEVIDDDKILLVRIPVDSEDVHQMITLSVIRNLWSAKKRQDRNPNRETKPFFLQVDEFEKVANDNLPIDDMLVRARSMWLSVTLGTQYPFQIEKDHSQVMRAMNNNANTLMAMRTPGERDAKILMSRFNDYDYRNLVNADFYRMWTKLPLEGGEESEPVNLKTFAPYPPLWTKRKIKAGLEQYTLDRYGAEPLSDEEIWDQLKFGHPAEVVDPGAAGTVEVNPDASDAFDQPLSGDMDVSDLPQENILEGVLAAQLRYSSPDELVAKDKAVEEVEKRFGNTGYQSIISNAFEQNEHIEWERVNDEAMVKLTNQGVNMVLSADTGSSASGGGDDHRLILKESWIAFTTLGALVRLPTQEGDSLPDGIADLPVDPMGAGNLPQVKEREERLKEDYPRLYEITDGRHIAIEAETSTIKKPMQTLSNLRKAMEKDKMCIFTCKDATFDDGDHDFTYWPRRGEQIIYDTSGAGKNIEIDYDSITCVPEVDENGLRTFYNKNAKFRIEDDVFPVRPATSSANELTWKEERQEGKNGIETHIVAEADDGFVAMRFKGKKGDPVDEVANPSRTDTTAYREQNEEGKWVVHKSQETIGPYGSLEELREDWQDLYTPLIPENEFPRMPEEDDFAFVIFPDGNNDEYDEPQLYERGELEPLFPEETAIEMTLDDESDETVESDESKPARSGGEEQTSAADHGSQPTDEGQESTTSDGREKRSTNSSTEENKTDDNGSSKRDMLG